MRPIQETPVVPDRQIVIQPSSSDLRLSARAQLLRKASARIPTTAEGLPVGFYRADLLPIEDDLSQQSDMSQAPTTSNGTSITSTSDAQQAMDAATKQLAEVEALRAAYVELSYEHSYPTLPNGEPFWHKLDYEPGLAYSTLQMYLEANTDGVRTLDSIATSEEFVHVLSASLGRSDFVTTTEALHTLNEFFILYNWRARAKAYDLFHEAAYRHTRMRRAMNMEDHHYKTAENLLTKVITYMESQDFIDNLGPKAAIDALSKLVAIQRISVGLPSGGPLPQKERDETSQFEAILRQVGVQQASASGQKEQAPGQARLLDALLQNPDTVKNMQELVIRVTTTNFAPTQKGNTVEGESVVVPEGATADDLAFHKDLG